MRIRLNFIRAMTRWRIMTLMIVVALSSLAIWATKTMIEHYRFRTIRAQRLSTAAVHATFRQIIEKTPVPSADPALSEWSGDTIRYHKGLEEKYRKGADEPEVDLKPDPPEPPLVDLNQIKREMDALKGRSAKLVRQFENIKRENSSSETRPDPSLKPDAPGPASSPDLDPISHRVELLEMRRAELTRKIEKRRRGSTLGNNSSKE